MSQKSYTETLTEEESNSLDVRISECARKFAQRDPETLTWTFENHQLFQLLRDFLNNEMARIREPIGNIRMGSNIESVIFGSRAARAVNVIKRLREENGPSPGVVFLREVLDEIEKDIAQRKLEKKNESS